MKKLLVPMALACAAAFAEAQGVSGVVTVTGGTTLTLTVTEANGLGVTQPSPCLFMIVRLGRPDGPVIVALPCAAVPTYIPPWGTRSQSYTPPAGNLVQVYYFQVDYFDAAGIFHSEFFAGMFPNTPTGTVLASSLPPHVGMPLALSLSSSLHPSSPYVLAASGTTNTGIAVSLPVFVSLDADPIFALSFPTPDPTLFTNFQGSLDSSGNAVAGLNIPNFPVLACKPLHVQAVILNGGGIASLSNPLNFTIMP